jgi:hypothetical protein
MGPGLGSKRGRRGRRPAAGGAARESGGPIALRPIHRPWQSVRARRFDSNIKCV